MKPQRARPRPWSTGDAGSFAQRTLAVRVPKILDDTVAANAFDDDTRARCRALRDELTGGVIRALDDDDVSFNPGADVAAWNAAAAPYVGRSWLEVPWYFAESFFYRRLLEAVRYFATGADPFLPVKREEERTAFPKARSTSSSLAARLHASLWGNRADLSYTAGLAHGASGGVDDLLADDTARAVELLTAARRVAIVLDNAGTELAFDLLLADALSAPVTLFAKSHPFFVSDATPADVARTARALSTSLPTRLHDVVAHPYMTSAGFLFTSSMPADLVDALAAHDVVVVKGDANYRRLVGDAPWPPSTPFADAVEFPAPIVALRTLKAEVALGIDRAPAEADWMVSGKYGVVQTAPTSYAPERQPELVAFGRSRLNGP